MPWISSIVPCSRPRGAVRFSTTMVAAFTKCFVTIRERSSGKPLHEARARSDNAGTSGEALRAMFEAALKDFPATGINPRSVIVPLPR